MFGPSGLYVGLGRLPVLPASSGGHPVGPGTLFPAFPRFDPRHFTASGLMNSTDPSSIHDIARRLVTRGTITSGELSLHSVDKIRLDPTQSSSSTSPGLTGPREGHGGGGGKWRRSPLRSGTPDQGLDLTCGPHSPKSIDDNPGAAHLLSFSIERILGSRSCHRQDERTSTERDSNSTEVKEEDEEEEVEGVGWMGDEVVEGEDEEEKPHTYSWLQCTRYKPPKLPRSKKKEGSRKRKLGRNPRVPFTQHQVVMLEQKFRQTHYLSSVDVAELSAALNLTETRVKIWFQNRRARERRDRDVPHKPGSSDSLSDGLKVPPTKSPKATYDQGDETASPDQGLLGIPLSYPFMQPVTSFPPTPAVRGLVTSSAGWRSPQSAFTPVLRLS